MGKKLHRDKLRAIARTARQAAGGTDVNHAREGKMREKLGRPWNVYRSPESPEGQKATLRETSDPVSRYS